MTQGRRPNLEGRRERKEDRPVEEVGNGYVAGQLSQPGNHEGHVGVEADVRCQNHGAVEEKVAGPGGGR